MLAGGYATFTIYATANEFYILLYYRTQSTITIFINQAVIDIAGSGTIQGIVGGVYQVIVVVASRFR